MRYKLFIAAIVLLVNIGLLQAQCPVVLEGNHSMCAMPRVYKIANYVGTATYQAFAVVNGSATTNFTINGTGNFTAVFPNGTTQAMVIVKVTSPCQSADTIWVQPCCGQDPPLANIVTDVQSYQIPGIVTAGNLVYNPVLYPTQSATIVVHGELDITNITEFYNTTILMDQGASLHIRSNKELVFINCTIKAYCNAMWEGIICDNGSRFKIRDNSVVRDAQYGVKCTGTVSFDMWNNVQFINNYAGVYAPPNAGGNTFGFVNGGNTSQSLNISWNGTPLLANFFGQNPVAQTRSYAGFLLYDMANYGNTIGSTTFGIAVNATTVGFAAFRSNVTLPGYVTITNIAATAGEYPNSSAYNGSGIYCDALSGTVPKSLAVGTSAAVKATVQNCRYGIFVNNNMNLNCKYNVIQNTSDMGAVRVTNCAARLLNINNNIINNGYHVGIYCKDISDATLHINNNNLNNGATYKPANVALGNTAIYVGMSAKIKPVTGYINNNVISNSRVGIDVSSVKGPAAGNWFTIDGNNISIARANNQLIDLSIPGQPVWVHYGIKLATTSNLVVTNNIITRTLPVPDPTVVPAYTTKMYGVQTTNTGNLTYVNSNTLKDFGTFVNMVANCSNTYYYCNTCSLTVVNGSNNVNTRGFYLNGAALTDQGSAVAPSDNEWVGWGLAATPLRIAGMCTNTAMATWYCRNTLNIYYPYPASVSGTFFNINTQASGTPACQGDIQLTTIIERVNAIVHNEIVYEYYPEESRYQDVLWAFNVLYDNPDLRAIDADFEAFYQDNFNENVSEFNRVEQYLNEEEYATALATLSAIEEANSYEYDLAYTLEIATLMMENPYYELDVTQMEELRRIGYLPVWEGGEGTINARVMMDMEVIDQLPFLRKAGSETKTNTATTMQQLLMQAPFAAITVYDSGGKTIYTGTVIGFDMMRNELTTGIYNYSVIADGVTQNGKWQLGK